MAASLPNSEMPWPFPLQPVVEPGTAPVTTAGSGLAGLVWRGSLLTIVTLGIYRFWYKTDLRRWYWRHTIVDGTAFEYRGTAKELLLGFLFALAVLVPLYATVALGGLFAGEVVGVALNVLFALFFMVLVQYGAYRSRRYRLTRTVWRGLRFDQTGSAWAYAGLTFAWAIPVLLSLGLLFPLMRRSLEGYRIRHTRFGTAEGRFAVAAWPVMRAWLVLIGPLLLIVLAVVGIGATVASARTDNGFAAIAAIGAGVGAVLALFAVGWAFLLWPFYRIREFRHFSEGTSIGPVSFRSAATAKAAYAIHIKFMLVVSVASSALGVIATAVVTQFGGSAGMRPEGPWFILAIVAAVPVYLGGVLTFGVLKELMLNQPYWRLLAGTLEVRGLDHLDEVLGGAVRDEAATGEGFADALDFGGV